MAVANSLDELNIEPVITDEVLLAQRDALARQLRAVLRLVDRGGFMWPEDQALVAGSEALLVEVEGTRTP